MSDVDVTVDEQTGVAVVRLDRPDKLNALRAESVARLEHAVDELEWAGTCRAIVLAGNGRAFCSGADLVEKRGFDEASRRSFLERGRAVLARIRSSRLLSVAALHGYVLGGGLELAMSCDLRVAASDALLGFPEAELGHLPGWDGPALLARLVGRQRALDMVLSSARVSAAEAAAMGLVDEVVPDGGHLAAAVARATAYAGRPPAVVGHVKESLQMPPKGVNDARSLV